MMQAHDTTPGVSLRALLEGLAEMAPGAERAIQGLALDSRTVRPGDLFIACAGTRSDGRRYIAEAKRAGAVAALVEDETSADASFDAPAHGTSVPLIRVARLRERIGLIADRFYASPSRELFVIGVTGTNGKTSCTQFLAQALDHPERRCGLIGTLGYGVPGALAPGAHTTPDAVRLHGLLSAMRERQVHTVAMEVSSHALDQARVAGVAFDLALWTNLTRDHLDYHGDMERYYAAKRRLFQQPGLRRAVVNADDGYGRRLLGELAPGVETVSYGMGAPIAGTAHVQGADLQLGPDGLSLRVTSPWGEGRLRSPLLGGFTASNLLGVLAALLAKGIAIEEALRRLAALRTVPGRMEAFGGGGTRPLAVVDYAHTPDALEQVLTALRGHCAGALWCVFGCGGDRDPGKRPAMGAVAERLADRVVVTDDNPRTEDPQRIVDDILAGMSDARGVRVDRDRAAAIRYALSAARPGDVVLIAGKGHEDYQILGTERRPFSDRALVASLLGEGAA
jgi:UDP-N-acetylmuramoyl-L-alanyl-D-glutamate--2,6-diaminopimelate ligase